MRYKLILRSRGGISLVTVLALMVVVFMVLILIVDGPMQVLRIVFVPAAAVFLAWWAWGWPLVEVSDDGVVIQNPLRTTFLPWRTVRSAEAKYGLQIYASDNAAVPAKRFYAAGVPAKGGFAQAVGSKKVITPEYKFTKGPVETVYLDPSVAKRIIEDEIYFHKKPKERPELSANADVALTEHLAAGKSADSNWKSKFQSSITSEWNWPMFAWQVGLIVVAVVLAIFVP